MAKKKGIAKSDAPPKPRQRRRRGGFGQFLVYILLGILLVMSPALAALVTVGLLPSLIMLFADTGDFKMSRLSATFAFNLSGVLPYAVALWDDGGDMTSLSNMLSDVFTWVVIYGAAAIGAGILWLGPVLAAAGQQIMNNDGVNKLLKERQLLLDEWGEDLGRTEDERRRAAQTPETGKVQSKGQAA